MSNETLINYAELPCRNLTATKQFFSEVFGWTFTDYGPSYVEFHDKGIVGGFYESDNASLTASGATLLVFYTPELESLQTKIERNGGTIIKPVFEFPGGRRFHFTEPSGNEFAVWSDK
ncbi:VOC family protein [Alteromonas lipolytica]|uniref:Glyoxalase n=1 Tax=Alteromonas lipolytica TaxID=1856405 RepID=A0A1E8FAG1_9ALTE|nr:VOC family protein [Alteromonas lipolytica]OFI32899.1 glyoxalase [Alteromonas lipolytica]GGF64378.1 glyoxalase [Alteromonas lipolytica]